LAGSLQKINDTIVGKNSGNKYDNNDNDDAKVFPKCIPCFYFCWKIVDDDDVKRVICRVGQKIVVEFGR